MKTSHFLVIGDFYLIFGDFLVETGEPTPYCDKIPIFMGSSKANLVLVNFEEKKSWDWVRLAKFPTFTENLFLGLPLTLNTNSPILSRNCLQLRVSWCASVETQEMHPCLSSPTVLLPAPKLRRCAQQIHTHIHTNVWVSGLENLP